MAATNNLYPPIISTYMPAFLVNSAIASKNICRVYFSLSQFNTVTQIKNVQVVVRNSSTNLSALNPTKYPSEIAIKPLQTDINRETDDKYYIEIEPIDMINQNFVIDQYYRVQLRFTDTEASNPPITAESQPIDEWLADNLLHFSEWSTVCLIRGISTPTLEIEDFTEETSTTIYANVANVRIVGELVFESDNETETLKTYEIKLYDENNKKILESGIQYTNTYTSTNEINYEFNYSFEAEHSYYFTIEYTTANLYSEIYTYNIDVEAGSQADIHVLCWAQPDNENGAITIKFSRSKAYGSFINTLLIRRTDSKSNFTVWDDIQIYKYLTVQEVNELWNDYTIENGIWYKYAIQGVDENGYRTPMVQIEEPILGSLQHIYLVAGDRQLKLEFNPSISAYAQHVSETKIDMLGSKYPFIKRNGNLNYTTFSLGGLISAIMDEDGTFITKDAIYGDNKDIYDTYNLDNEISQYSDFIYEKFFRDNVKEFLEESTVKLFRSPTEGNMLIKLMNINYNPNQTLGRNIWSFTSNASEIDECTIDNYNKYNIITKEKVR